MAVATFVFYLFAALLTGAALMVITARNPVHSVLFLIFAFFNAAALVLLLGAEYIAMTLVIVYVGAVAVLFLFVVMMLDINFAALRQGFLRYLPLGAALAGLLFFELMMIFAALDGGEVIPMPAANPIPDAETLTNTEALGRVLYTNYVFLFQLAGIILLVAMIGAIVLTHRHRPGVKRQKIARQVNRARKDAVTLVQMRSGEGA
jgi:NADH-quinone oxidoreductase subunit J